MPRLRATPEANASERLATSAASSFSHGSNCLALPQKGDEVSSPRSTSTSPCPVPPHTVSGPNYPGYKRTLRRIVALVITLLLFAAWGETRWGGHAGRVLFGVPLVRAAAAASASSMKDTLTGHEARPEPGLTHGKPGDGAHHSTGSPHPHDTALRERHEAFKRKSLQQQQQQQHRIAYSGDDHYSDTSHARPAQDREEEEKLDSFGFMVAGTGDMAGDDGRNREAHAEEEDTSPYTHSAAQPHVAPAHGFSASPAANTNTASAKPFATATPSLTSDATTNTLRRGTAARDKRSFDMERGGQMRWREYRGSYPTLRELVRQLETAYREEQRIKQACLSVLASRQTSNQPRNTSATTHVEDEDGTRGQSDNASSPQQRQQQRRREQAPSATQCRAALPTLRTTLDWVRYLPYLPMYPIDEALKHLEHETDDDILLALFYAPDLFNTYNYIQWIGLMVKATCSLLRAGVLEPVANVREGFPASVFADAAAAAAASSGANASHGVPTAQRHASASGKHGAAHVYCRDLMLPSTDGLFTPDDIARMRNNTVRIAVIDGYYPQRNFTRQLWRHLGSDTYHVKERDWRPTTRGGVSRAEGRNDGGNVADGAPSSATAADAATELLHCSDEEEAEEDDEDAENDTDETEEETVGDAFHHRKTLPPSSAAAAAAEGEELEKHIEGDVGDTKRNRAASASAAVASRRRRCPSSRAALLSPKTRHALPVSAALLRSSEDWGPIFVEQRNALLRLLAHEGGLFKEVQAALQRTASPTPTSAQWLAQSVDMADDAAVKAAQAGMPSWSERQEQETIRSWREEDRLHEWWYQLQPSAATPMQGMKDPTSAPTGLSASPSPSSATVAGGNASSHPTTASSQSPFPSDAAMVSTSADAVHEDDHIHFLARYIIEHTDDLILNRPEKLMAVLQRSFDRVREREQRLVEKIFRDAQTSKYRLHVNVSAQRLNEFSSDHLCETRYQVYLHSPQPFGVVQGLGDGAGREGEDADPRRTALGVPSMFRTPDAQALLQAEVADDLDLDGLGSKVSCYHYQRVRRSRLSAALGSVSGLQSKQHTQQQQQPRPKGRNDSGNAKPPSSGAFESAITSPGLAERSRTSAEFAAQLKDDSRGARDEEDVANKIDKVQPGEEREGDEEGAVEGELDAEALMMNYVEDEAAFRELSVRYADGMDELAFDDPPGVRASQRDGVKGPDSCAGVEKAEESIVLQDGEDAQDGGGAAAAGLAAARGVEETKLADAAATSPGLSGTSRSTLHFLGKAARRNYLLRQNPPVLLFPRKQGSRPYIFPQTLLQLVHISFPGAPGQVPRREHARHLMHRWGCAVPSLRASSTANASFSPDAAAVGLTTATASASLSTDNALPDKMDGRKDVDTAPENAATATLHHREDGQHDNAGISEASRQNSARTSTATDTTAASPPPSPRSPPSPSTYRVVSAIDNPFSRIGIEHLHYDFVISGPTSPTAVLQLLVDEARRVSLPGELEARGHREMLYRLQHQQWLDARQRAVERDAEAEQEKAKEEEEMEADEEAEVREEEWEVRGRECRDDAAAVSDSADNTDRDEREGDKERWDDSAKTPASAQTSEASKHETAVRQRQLTSTSDKRQHKDVSLVSERHTDGARCSAEPSASSTPAAQDQQHHRHGFDQRHGAPCLCVPRRTPYRLESPSEDGVADAEHAGCKEAAQPVPRSAVSTAVACAANVSVDCLEAMEEAERERDEENRRPDTATTPASSREERATVRVADAGVEKTARDGATYAATPDALHASTPPNSSSTATTPRTPPLHHHLRHHNVSHVDEEEHFFEHDVSFRLDPDRFVENVPLTLHFFLRTPADVAESEIIAPLRQRVRLLRERLVEDILADAFQYGRCPLSGSRYVQLLRHGADAAYVNGTRVRSQREERHQEPPPSPLNARHSCSPVPLSSISSNASLLCTSSPSSAAAMSCAEENATTGFAECASTDNSTHDTGDVTEEVPYAHSAEGRSAAKALRNSAATWVWRLTANLQARAIQESPLTVNNVVFQRDEHDGSARNFPIALPRDVASILELLSMPYDYSLDPVDHGGTTSANTSAGAHSSEEDAAAEDYYHMMPFVLTWFHRQMRLRRQRTSSTISLEASLHATATRERLRRLEKRFTHERLFLLQVAFRELVRRSDPGSTESFFQLVTIDREAAMLVHPDEHRRSVRRTVATPTLPGASSVGSSLLSAALPRIDPTPIRPQKCLAPYNNTYMAVMYLFFNGTAERHFRAHPLNRRRMRLMQRLDEAVRLSRQARLILLTATEDDHRTQYLDSVIQDAARRFFIIRQINKNRDLAFRSSQQYEGEIQPTALAGAAAKRRKPTASTAAEEGDDSADPRRGETKQQQRQRAIAGASVASPYFPPSASRAPHSPDGAATAAEEEEEEGEDGDGEGEDDPADLYESYGFLSPFQFNVIRYDMEAPGRGDRGAGTRDDPRVTDGDAAWAASAAFSDVQAVAIGLRRTPGGDASVSATATATPDYVHDDEQQPQQHQLKERGNADGGRAGGHGSSAVEEKDASSGSVKESSTVSHTPDTHAPISPTTSVPWTDEGSLDSDAAQMRVLHGSPTDGYPYRAEVLPAEVASAPSDRMAHGMALWQHHPPPPPPPHAFPHPDAVKAHTTAEEGRETADGATSATAAHPDTARGSSSADEAGESIEGEWREMANDLLRKEEEEEEKEEATDRQRWRSRQGRSTSPSRPWSPRGWWSWHFPWREATTTQRRHEAHDGAADPGAATRSDHRWQARRQHRRRRDTDEKAEEAGHDATFEAREMDTDQEPHPDVFRERAEEDEEEERQEFEQGGALEDMPQILSTVKTEEEAASIPLLWGHDGVTESEWRRRVEQHNRRVRELKRRLLDARLRWATAVWNTQEQPHGGMPAPPENRPREAAQQRQAEEKKEA